MKRLKDLLKSEVEFMNNCASLSTREPTQEDQCKKLDEIRGQTMMIEMLEEMIDDDYAIANRS
jgi:hypothetical protein